MAIQVVLYPCRGTPELDISVLHVYALGLEEPRSYLSGKEAHKMFPGGFNISGKTVLCPVCEAYRSGKIEMNLRKR
ncbi:MAG TPA: hypothetical protein VJ485_01275 [archaeon]|nr:hypothetical protein [archaeon]